MAKRVRAIEDGEQGRKRARSADRSQASRAERGRRSVEDLPPRSGAVSDAESVKGGDLLAADTYFDIG